MYRLLATDIDDTILTKGGVLPKANHDALERLHRDGCTVVFSSGRATVSMQVITARIIEPDDDEYLISFNGARVVRAKSSTPVFEWLVPADVISFFVQYAEEHDTYIQGYTNGKAYTTGATIDTDERRAEYKESTQMPVHLTDNLITQLGPSTPKLLIIDDPPNVMEHIERLTPLSNGRYRLTRSKPHYLEILHPAVSKGAALIRLAGELGIPIEETIAVGDNHNDIEMIKTAGLGVAVANAVPELKEVADVVLDRSVEQGAMGEIVERFFS